LYQLNAKVRYILSCAWFEDELLKVNSMISARDTLALFREGFREDQIVDSNS